MKQLRMIEETIGPQPGRAEPLAKPDRDTLRQFLRFFTGRVGVHYKREEALIRVLGRLLGHKREEGEQLQHLLVEHRAMKSDAARIAKTLKGRAGDEPCANGSDPLGLRTFVRQCRAHISCEERVLFLLAEMRLTSEQKTRISHRMLQM